MSAFVVGRPLAVQAPRVAADAIVVLGAPPWPDGSLTPVLEERVVAAAALYHARLAPLVLVTGGRGAGARHPGTEADAMARGLLALGLPASALVLEPEATCTEENAARSAALLLPDRRRVFVVTQPFHLRRACLWFRRQGFEPLGHALRGGVHDARPARALRFAMGEWVKLLVAQWR